MDGVGHVVVVVVLSDEAALQAPYTRTGMSLHSSDVIGVKLVASET